MLSDDIRSAILATHTLEPKRKGDRLYFRCPRHEDKTPSAWMAGGAWGCFSCGFEESITTLAGEVGVSLNGNGDGKYTLERYADEKGLSVADLMSWGLETREENGKTVVRIPYYDEGGNELRARFRSRTGKWWEGRNRPIYLYGVDRLVDLVQGNAVIVVEGESDCHALWSEGFAAVGVPGATTWRKEWADYLKGLTVYVWEEPDQGGAQMVERLVGSFPEARVIKCDQAKDACELRAKTGQAFRATMRGLLDEARPHNATEPPVPFEVLTPTRFERLLDHQLAPIDAVPTPFPSWNQTCRDEGGGEGIARGWHVLAAARTGTGKSILALNMAAKAMRGGEVVCFLSLEMSQVQVETRLMAILSGTPVRSLEKGRHFDTQAFSAAAKAFEGVPGKFLTNRAVIHSVHHVVESMKAMHEIHGARYFVVDYLQLAGNPNDPESITEVSSAVRKQAKDLQVITLGLSQFNRSTSTLNETPTVHGMMGGSSLENDADQIVLIDHSKVEESTDKLSNRIGWTSNLVLPKNRHGPAGAIPMLFNVSNLQMRELMPDEIPANLTEQA